MMDGILDMEGPVMGFFERVGQLIVLSGLWLLGCIPVVTICTSNAALYYAVHRQRQGEGTAVTNFLKAYRENFLLGIMMTLSIGAAGFATVAVLSMLQGSGYPTSVIGLAFVFLVFILVYIGPVLSRFRIGFSRTIKLTFAMSMQYAHYTLLLVLGLGILVLLQLFVLPIPTVLVVPGVWTYLTSFLVEKVLDSYIAKNADQDDLGK